MKTIITIKLFLVLCCHTVDNGQYQYDVKSLDDTTQTGVVFTGMKYSEGDTIKIVNYK